ncbi:MAG: hypothetical protein ABIX28_08905 [Vicinamibacterales bacterium]
MASIAWATSGSAQETRIVGKVPAPPASSLAQDVVLAAYPELRDRRIDWRLAVSAEAVTVEAREAVLPAALSEVKAERENEPFGPPLAELRTVLVRAVAQLDVDGTLVRLQIDGVLPRPSAFVAAKAAAVPLEALRGMRPKFAPDQPVTAESLAPNRLLRLLGASEASTPSFDEQPVGDGEALTWTLAVSSSTKGATSSYSLIFEPVEGRLLAVVRR